MANSGSKNDIYFQSIAIKPPATTDVPEPEFVQLPLTLGGSEVSIFGGMEIVEDIFDNGGLRGFITLNNIDPVPFLAKTGSLIKFSFATNNPDEPGAVNRVVGLQFYIYNVSIVSNIAPGVIRHGGSSQDFAYRLEFASFESTSLQFEELPIFQDDWVGTISQFISLQLNKYFSFVEDAGPEEILSKNTSQIEPGNHNVVSTYNGIWWKTNQSLYPWGKEKKIPNLNTLFKASANYAIPDVIDLGDLGDVPGSDENLGGFGGGLDIPGEDLSVDGSTPLRGSPDVKNPSYVFYQSMPDGKWNFTPIGGSNGLYGKRYTEGLGYHEYQLTNDETIQKRIENFTIGSFGDLLDLQQSGAFACHYDLIEPNWAGVYNNIQELGCANPNAGGEGSDDTETLNSYEQSIIGQRQTAYYHDFMSLSTHLSHDRIEYKYEDLFDVDDDGDVIGIGPLLGGQLLSDGLEDPGSSSLRDPVYGYFDSRYLNKPYPTENDDYASGRGQKYTWQTMFDICDFPLYNNEETGEIGIHHVVNQYRKPCKKAIFAYTVLADIKEQWNRYRHTICCDGSGRDNFMAMLVGYTGGYGTDSDGQVIQDRNIIPFGLSGGNTGPDNTYHYSFVEVEIWPKVLIPQGISAADVIPEFEDESVTYFDYLESIDLNTATGPNYVKKIFLPDYAGGTGGITFEVGLPKANASEQEYKIHQEQEFFVIPVDGGRRGLFNAYNVVELVNNKAFTNVGVNKLGYNYPSGFSLSPIGGMTSGITDETTPINPTYMGSIVEMQSLKESDLLEIQTEQDMIDDGLGYTGPDLEGTTCEKVVGLLNMVTGTDNVPRIFGGSTLDISYSVNGQYIHLDRDDKEDRPCIANDAKPQGSGTDSGSAGSLTGITADSTLYLFYSENDHDGRCSSE
jgi:hypothetical protein